MATLIVGDFNGDGKDDLAGLAADGHIWYTIKLDPPKWGKVCSSASGVVVGDFNGDGKDDLAGVAADDGTAMYITDLPAGAWYPLCGPVLSIYSAR